MDTVDIREHTLRAVAGSDDFAVRCLAPRCRWQETHTASAVSQESVLAAWARHVDAVKAQSEVGFPVVSPAMSYDRRDPGSVTAHRLVLAHERAATTQKRLAARTVGREVRRSRRESRRRRHAIRRSDRRNLWWAWSRTSWAARTVWILGHVLAFALALIAVLVLVVLVLRTLLPVVLGGVIIYGAFILARRALSST